MADKTTTNLERPTHKDPDRRWLVRVVRDETAWADGYGATKDDAQADAVAKLDSSPGLVGKFR